MHNISSSTQQYRQAIGNHLRWLDEKQGTQQSQNRRIQQLANEPGAHEGNRIRHGTAHAYVQLLSMLSTVQSSPARFATNLARVEELRLEHRLLQADALYRQRRSDQAIRRDCKRDAGRADKDVHRPGSATQRATPTGVINAVTGSGTRSGHGWGPSLAHAASMRSAASPARLPLVMLNGSAAHDFIAALVRGDDGSFMADEIGKVTTGKELMLTAIPQTETGKMEKRAALADLVARDNADYHDYLRNNCHIRTKTVAGHPLGDGLLVTGEYFRNPWRGMAEALSEALTPGRQMTQNEEFATEIFNVGSDIGLAFITGGAYPIIKYGIAKSLSIGGQATNGDMTCLKREFSPEEMARLLFDTETGITHHQTFPTLQRKSADIAEAATFAPSGLFVEQHLPSGIQKEKYMVIRKDGADVLIREKTPGIFVTCHPYAAHPEQLERQVFFDAQSQRIFFDSEFAHGQGYEADIVDGRHFIEIQGEPFELVVHADKRLPAIRLQQKGVSKQLPVYMEKLSHNWHLDVHNNRPVFANWQTALIDRLRLASDAGRTFQAVDNLNPQAYGNARIYEMRRADAGPYAPAETTVIEMHGELVPVRARVIEGHGVRYEVFDLSATQRYGRPVEWNGQRWIFEKNTSAHVAPALKKAIDPAMTDRTISAQDLSAPDQRGIRWDRQDRGYLKIKGGFVRMRQYGYHPDAWFVAHEGKKTNLFFHHNRFHPETYRHRLQRIQTQGLSGRGAAGAPKRPAVAAERTALEVVQEHFDFTAIQATAYLRQFHFQPSGRFSEREFAAQMERYNAEPQWPRRMQPAVAPPVAEASGARQPSTSSGVALGERLSAGNEGVVYLDANDPTFVIKKLKDAVTSYLEGSSGSSVDDMTAYAMKMSADEQVAIFNQYYGEGMAETIVQGNHVFVRMPKIPGKELRSLEKGDIPEDGVERFVDMLERLAEAGIWHGDLHEGNVFFDTADNMFYPIDFSNIEQRFQRAGPETRHNLIVRGDYLWDRIIGIIRSKQADSSPKKP